MFKLIIINHIISSPMSQSFLFFMTNFSDFVTNFSDNVINLSHIVTKTSVLSNRGFFTNEFRRNTVKSGEFQSFGDDKRVLKFDKNSFEIYFSKDKQLVDYSSRFYKIQGFEEGQRVLNFGIDTVRLKFYFSNNEQLKEYIGCSYKEIVSFNIVKLKKETIFIYYNIFGQKFYYNPLDRSVFLEFSLPKFLKYQNSTYCNEFDLFSYCNNYLAPYCYNQYILLNRIDFAVQFPFFSPEELAGFDKFLRSCSIRNHQSSQDYCFWKFEERVIRFYDKRKDVERPGNKSHPSLGQHYNEWLKTLRWCEDKNVGRLEYQLRLGYIKDKNKDRQVYKVDYAGLRNRVNEMYQKDFPFKDFYFDSKRPFYDIIQSIKKAFQRPDSYLEFIIYAVKFGIPEARKLVSQQMYSHMRIQLKKRLNLTFEQILSAGHTIISFPKTTVWEEKPERINHFADFQNLILKNAHALLEDGLTEEDILREIQYDSE